MGDLLARFKDHLVTLGISDGSIRNYLSDLNHFQSWLTSSYPKQSITDINSEHPLAYRTYLVHELEAPVSSVNRRLSSLRQFFTWAVTQNLLSSHPMQGLSNISIRADNTEVTPQQSQPVLAPLPIPAVASVSIPGSKNPRKFPVRVVILALLTLVVLTLASLNAPNFLSGGVNSEILTIFRTLPSETTLDLQTTSVQEITQNKRLDTLDKSTQELSFDQQRLQEEQQSTSDFAINTQGELEKFDSSTENSIQNSSFELNPSGAPLKWQYFNFSSGSNTVVTQDGAHTGGNVLKLSLDGIKYGGLTQSQSITRSDSASALSVWVRGSGLSYNGLIKLGFKDDTGKYTAFQDFYLGGSFGWQRLTVSANAQGLYPAIEFRGYSSGTAYLDDWQLTGGRNQIKYAENKSSGQGSVETTGKAEITPVLGGSGSLGTLLNRFGSLYLSGATIDTLGNVSISGTTISKAIKPLADKAYDLGTSTLYYRTVYAQSIIADGSTISGNQTILGNLSVSGTSTFGGNVSAGSNLNVVGASTLLGLLTTNGGIITNNSSINAGSGSISGGSIAGVTLTTTGNTSVGGDLTVSGATTLNGLTTLNANFIQTGATTFSTGTGLTSLNGPVNLGLSSSNDVAVNGRFTTSLVPKLTANVDLGSTTLRWNNLWVQTINATGTNTSGQASFTYDPLDTTITQSSVLINPTSAGPNEGLLGLAIGGAERARLDTEGDLALGFAGGTLTPNSNPLTIYNHGTVQVATVDIAGNAYFAGNVGIGDSIPSVRLALGGTGSANGIVLGDDAIDPVNLYRSAANTLKTDDDLVIGSTGNGKITVGVVDPYLITNTGTFQAALEFRTTATAGADDFVFTLGGAERARLTETGNLTILGTFTAQSTSTSTFSGAIDMQNNVILNIGNAGTDFVATTGALNLAGVLNANGGITLGTSQTFSATSGIISATGLSSSTLSTTSANLTLSTVTSGTLALTSAGALNLSAGATSTFTLANVANALNFDADTLSIDALNNRVGIGTASPGANLEINASSPTLLLVGATGTATTVQMNNPGYSNWSMSSSGNNFNIINSSGPITFLNFSRGSPNSTSIGSNLSISGTTTSSGLLTASNGLSLIAGALNLTSTSGSISVAGLGSSTISTTSANLTISTATSGTLALTSAGALNLTAGAASTFALANVVNALNFDSDTLSIDALNNRVGIGTTSPVARLDFSNAGTFPSDIIGFYNGGSAIRYGIGIDIAAAQNGLVFYSGDRGFTFKSQSLTATGTQLVTITNSGNVGIGTTGPSEKLEVENGNVLLDHSNLKLTPELSPGAPTVAINAVAGNLNGAYTYKITFVTASGETQGGTTSASVSPVNQQVNLTAIPTGTAGFVTARKIYRTAAAGADGTQKLVTTIADNTTTTYTDNLADLSLGATVSKSNSTANIQVTTTENLYLVAGTGKAVVIGDGTGKITAGLFDPAYKIDGINYSTYAPSMLGVKEEITGSVALLYDQANNNYFYTIDLVNQPQGSDLWVFSRISDPDVNMTAVLVSANSSARVWYLKDVARRSVTIFSDRGGEVSYRLTAPRFDYLKWNTLSEDQTTNGLTPPPAQAPVGGEAGSLSVNSYFGAFSENFNTTGTVTAGDLLSVDQASVEGKLTRPAGAYDARLTGVATSDGPIATVTSAGRVQVRVSVENGNITPGDHLTSSATKPGFAMKATQAGRTIGVALQPLTGADGMVLVSVTPSWFDPAAPIYNPNGTVAPTSSSTTATYDTLTATTANITNLNVGGVAIVTDPSGNLKINGNVLVTGTGTFSDVRVNGLLTIIGSISAPNGLAVNLGLSKAFEIKNAVGDTVAQISDEGVLITKSAQVSELKVSTGSAQPTTGTTIFRAGGTSMLIETTKITGNSKVIVTFKGNYAPATRYWTSDEVVGSSFTLHLDQAPSSDVSFSWWIVN